MKKMKKRRTVKDRASGLRWYAMPAAKIHVVTII